MNDEISKNRFLGRKSVQIAYFKPFHGHIHNPGMGIISMAISDHMTAGYTPEVWSKTALEKPFKLTQKMLDEVTILPYIDNLYIRVGWDDVQKEKGRLDLIPEFNMAVEAAEKAGISWGFRIMHCSPSNPKANLLPEFLANKLPTVDYDVHDYYGPNPRKLPIYTEDYLKYWDEMLQMLGGKFDHMPSLEYGDISGFGFWGEGHHDSYKIDQIEKLHLTDNGFIEEIVGRLIKSHEQAFPKTPMVLNLHLSEFEAGREAIKKGSWVRRDSYYEWFNAPQAEAGILKCGDAAMIFETIMPGNTMEDFGDPSFQRNNFDTAGSMCDYGANYGIVGFNSLDTLYADHVMPQLFDAFKERVGYRLRPSIIWKIENQDGSWSLVLGIVNDGRANPPGDVTFQAESNGKIRRSTVNGSRFGGRMYMVELPLPEGHNDTVKLTMALTMKGKSHLIRLAVDTGKAEAPCELVIHMYH